jgi:AraC-like DNA-binding protein/mannose-6-phosphate isomerase-like protein (cupin superfamily)
MPTFWHKIILHTAKIIKTLFKFLYISIKILYICVMIRYKQYSPFVILEIDTDIWNHPIHNHNYFEIIVINKGNGTHVVNNIEFNYNAGDVFLLAPEDYHYFKIEKRTSFSYFKFTEHLFSKDGNIQDKAKWMQKIESILFNPNLIPGNINYYKGDRERILKLADMILHEHHNSNCYNEDIITDAMSIIISLIARNTCNSYFKNQITTPVNGNRINEILTYIRQHVYESDRMKMESLAERFGMSKNYISIFFKKHTGESLQQYIMKYRLKLVENRLHLSDFTISEIAYQLGFTDESHLIKHFKKHYGISPGESRKKNHLLIKKRS